MNYKPWIRFVASMILLIVSTGFERNGDLCVGRFALLVGAMLFIGYIALSGR